MKKNQIEKYLKENKDYYEIIKPIIENEEFKKRKKYKHHENISVYEHSLIVSITSYKLARKLKIDYKRAAIGGLLHDFYDKPWQEKKEKQKFFQQHGFVHAKEAVKNSYKYFPNIMDKKIENIIKRHMFPLNIIPPRYKESWLVSLMDKKSSMDILKYPKEWPKYVGLKKKERK